MARSATTIRLLKIPALPLALSLLLRLPQSYLSFPLLLFSFLPFPLLLPHVPLDLHAAMPLLPVQLLTLATNLPAFLGSPLVARKSQQWSRLPTLLALPLAFLLFRFADWSFLHVSRSPFDLAVGNCPACSMRWSRVRPVRFIVLGNEHLFS